MKIKPVYFVSLQTVGLGSRTAVVGRTCYFSDVLCKLKWIEWYILMYDNFSNSPKKLLPLCFYFVLFYLFFFDALSVVLYSKNTDTNKILQKESFVRLTKHKQSKSMHGLMESEYQEMFWSIFVKVVAGDVSRLKSFSACASGLS